MELDLPHSLYFFQHNCQTTGILHTQDAKKDTANNRQYQIVYSSINFLKISSCYIFFLLADSNISNKLKQSKQDMIKKYNHMQ